MVKVVGVVHDWGTDDLTLKLGSKRLTISTSLISIAGSSRLGELYVAEPKEMWEN